MALGLLYGVGVSGDIRGCRGVRRALQLAGSVGTEGQ